MSISTDNIKSLVKNVNNIFPLKPKCTYMLGLSDVPKLRIIVQLAYQVPGLVHASSWLEHTPR